MQNVLFVYNGLDSLHQLKQRLSDLDFYSIAYFYNEYDSIDKINDIEDDYDDIVIDISNVMYDNANIFFSERYISKLNELKNVYFCIDTSAYKILRNKYPLLFDEEYICQEFNNESTSNIELEQEQDIKILTPAELYIYEKRNDEEGFRINAHASTLSNIIDNSEGIFLSYNCKKIKEFIESEKIEYVDISSAIYTLKIRHDQLFYFEKLFLQISQMSDAKFCVEDNLAIDALRLFPLLFYATKQIDLFLKTDDISEARDDDNTEINVSSLESKINNISNSLKGHDEFKKDFKQKFLKFSFLNSMKERKLFSIIICGESGIGKTEFAKILSNELYPNSPLIKINFGNYSTEGVLNSLIGSPLGYVGSEEGGELIKKIESSGTKVILIDEFEKATSSVYNFFYELLEDGVFTDRHGVEHNLNGYIIVFTSNMSQTNYKNHIPDSLKSRFDMVYYFVDLSTEEKLKFIFTTANNLLIKLKENFATKIDIMKISSELDELCQYNNLREIKRKVEDVVFNEFFKLYTIE